ncbi:N-acetylglucosamine-6-phosphate deacetylase [Chitinophaga sancti]|uniref:N-acetylglucosamine-6-phosphate deacetylase n=1 Tax=Chitinophaga sancti TaxID=1004 RepID=A0A1K1RJK5_9BACT|nr:N-acetylglucosamine-6-phosphate deacetylase [Chitinophaga sancti]WQD60700.1 N-acetylglucosamine-6-phosphate deacetylase [Chitinophaga sancti]WQG87172.1 N-acetylglucosamine-6-phosphate deacetylase [Chitinophaga sancti]SFW72028.1 N-acetylglucosamine-6-phosphate deacetylase [Chitinophaga sancti]
MLNAYSNCRIFTGDNWLEDHVVLSENGRITDIVTQRTIPPHAIIHDLNGADLVPAFIDLQIYGGNGRYFPSLPDVESIKATYEYSKAGGAAYFMITIPTHSPEFILRSIAAVKEYWEQGGEGCLGLHLEGPYISPEKNGAHIPEYIKAPRPEDIDWVLTHGAGIVKMMTVAPERVAPELILRLQDAGVLVSAGHSNGTYGQLYQSFENGITTCTHLFNAMSQLQSRAPGMVGAIYDHPQVHASIVADGIHVDYNTIRISKKIMANRLFLITDAVAASDGPDYAFHWNALSGRYEDAKGTLSGSALTMLEAVKNCIAQVGIAPDEALRMAAAYPAVVAGLSAELGRIAPGFRTAMLALDESWAFQQLILS